MGGEWKPITLGDALSFANGKTSPERSEGLRYPVYGSNGVIGFTNDTNAPENTIVIGRVGSYCGSLYLSKQKCWVTDNAIRASALDENDARFLFYVLSTLDLNHWRAGSGQPLLNQTILGQIPASIPLPNEQRAIAHILGTLDDKIELNRRMNETLEAMARAIFQSWFVDFDPVRAKVEGREPGLPKEIADLFPDSFEESESGEIPAGWGIGMLADLAELNPETWTKSTAPYEIEYVDLANTKWGKIEQTQRYLWEDAPSRAQRVLRPGDTIIGTVRPGNGSFAFVTQEGLTGSTGFAALRPRKAIYEEYTYLVATLSDNIDRLSHLADGAAYPAVRPDVVLSTQAILPGDSLLKCFASVAKPIMAKIAHNEREARTLATLRDTLLPKLLSGELRVTAENKGPNHVRI